MRLALADVIDHPWRRAHKVSKSVYKAFGGRSLGIGSIRRLLFRRGGGRRMRQRSLTVSLGLGHRPPQAMSSGSSVVCREKKGWRFIYSYLWQRLAALLIAPSFPPPGALLIFLIPHVPRLRRGCNRSAFLVFPSLTGLTVDVAVHTVTYPSPPLPPRSSQDVCISESSSKRPLSLPACRTVTKVFPVSGMSQTPLRICQLEQENNSFARMKSCTINCICRSGSHPS